jgi:hypothetical protein
MIRKPKVLALDLEGTLIEHSRSNAPRPGLYNFLEYCRSKFPRIVMMTAVDRRTFEESREYLLLEGFVPNWFSTIEYIEYHNKPESNYGHFKDLRCIPFCDEDDAILIEDMEWFIRESQKDRWIPIKPYWGQKDDDEFEKIKKYLDWLLGN